MHPAPTLQQKISAAHIRVPYEITTLFLTFAAVIAILSLLSIAINFVSVVIFIIVALFILIVQQGIFLGNGVRVSEDQFPEVHQLVEKAGKKLNLPVKPRVFILQDPHLNAFTIGYGRWHSIVLYSALVEAMDKDELLFIIAHEMGHIKASHVILSSIIIPFGDFLPLTQLIFGVWWRKAELTADRAGAIVVPNIAVAISSFAKLAIGKNLYHHLDLVSFIRQGKDVDATFANQAGQLLENHPYLTNRIKQLTLFVKSPRYHTLVTESFGATRCTHCGMQNTLTATFCVGCGKPLTPVPT